jgi:hypothetical protein
VRTTTTTLPPCITSSSLTITSLAPPSTPSRDENILNDVGRDDTLSAEQLELLRRIDDAERAETLARSGADSIPALQLEIFGDSIRAMFDLTQERIASFFDSEPMTGRSPTFRYLFPQMCTCGELRFLSPTDSTPRLFTAPDEVHCCKWIAPPEFGKSSDDAVLAEAEGGDRAVDASDDDAETPDGQV